MPKDTVPEKAPTTGTGTGTGDHQRSSGSATGATAKRPKVIPHKPKDAPQFTDEMTSEQKEKLTQAFIARRKAEGAYKPTSLSAEDVQAGAKALFEASNTTIGKGIGKGIDEGLGVNAVAHAQNALLATQIGAAATARLDETNISRAEAARVDNRIASKNLHSSVEDFKDHKGEGFLSSLPASGEERRAGAQNLMDTHGEKEFIRRYQESKGNKALLALGRKLAANRRLVAHDRKMGNDLLTGWTQEQTVGEAVPEHMAKDLTPGHTIASTDVVASSTKGDLARGLESLNPMSDRPLGNTAKLNDEQKLRLETYTAMRDALKEKQTEDLQARAALKAADPDSRGYHPEELARRGELKAQLADLDAARSADRAKRIGTDATGYTHTSQEYQRLDVHNTAIEGIISDQRDAQKSAYEDTYEELHDKTRGRVRRTVFSGTLPPDLAAELASSKQELAQLTSSGKSSGWMSSLSRSKASEPAAPPDAATQLKIEQLRLRIHDLETQKASGLSPEEYERKKSAKAEMARLDKADASELDLSPQARTMVDQHSAAKDDIEFQRVHGLNRQQQEEYESATQERTSQKSARDTGLTDGEQELLDFLDQQIAGVYDEAKIGRAFVKEHEGEQVSALGRVGGLDSSDSVPEEKMAVTKAGRAAQAARATGSVVGGAGDVLNASKKNIQKAIDNGELLKASAQLAGSVAGDVAATAGNVQVPGIGTVSKKALKALGAVLQGSGRAIHAIGDAAAQGQDQRDRQRELTSGDRLEAAHTKAIDFDHLEDKKPDTLGSLKGGLSTVVNSGFEPIDDAKEQLQETASEAANDVVASTTQGGQRLAAGLLARLKAARADVVPPPSNIGSQMSEVLRTVSAPVSDTAHSLSDRATEELGSASASLPDDLLTPTAVPQITSPSLDDADLPLPGIDIPRGLAVEPLRLDEPRLSHLSGMSPPITAASLDLNEVPSPTFRSEEEARGSADEEDAGSQALGADPSSLSVSQAPALEPADLTFLGHGPGPEGEARDDEQADDSPSEHLTDEAASDAGDEDGGGAEQDEHDEHEDGAGPDTHEQDEHEDEEDGGEQEEEEDEEEEDEEDEEEQKKPAAAQPAQGDEEEEPQGFTYHRDYRQLFDRMAGRPSLWQRIKRGASNAWSSITSFLGFGRNDSLADHIGTPMRDRSVKPMLDRLSDSQSLSARMGRGASKAWSSFTGLFGGRKAPAPQEDDPASHIGDTIRRRKRPRKI